MHAITESLALLWCLWQRPTGATLLCRVGRWDCDHLHARNALLYRILINWPQPTSCVDFARRVRAIP